MNLYLKSAHSLRIYDQIYLNLCSFFDVFILPVLPILRILTYQPPLLTKKRFAPKINKKRKIPIFFKISGISETNCQNINGYPTSGRSIYQSFKKGLAQTVLFLWYAFSVVFCLLGFSPYLSLSFSSSNFLRYSFSRRVASRSKTWYLIQTRR